MELKRKLLQIVAYVGDVAKEVAGDQFFRVVRHDFCGIILFLLLSHMNCVIAYLFKFFLHGQIERVKWVKTVMRHTARMGDIVVHHDVVLNELLRCT